MDNSSATPGGRCGFWRRAAARIVDALVTVGTFFTGFLVLGVGTLAAGSEQPPEWVLLGWAVTMAVGYAVYEVAMIAVRGQTVGKQAFGVQVCAVDGSGQVGWNRSLRRFVTLAVLALVPFIGMLLCLASTLWGSHRGGVSWHDRPARTVTVRAGDTATAATAAARSRPAERDSWLASAGKTLRWPQRAAGDGERRV